MEHLYERANGDLLRVPWIHKLIALKALGQVGRAEAVPILRVYAADTSEYVDVRTNSQTGEVRRTAKKFSDLAQDAIVRVDARQRGNEATRQRPLSHRETPRSLTRSRKILP